MRHQVSSRAVGGVLGLLWVLSLGSCQLLGDTGKDQADRDSATDTGTTGATSTASSHPPIYVIFQAHGHNYGFTAVNPVPAQWMLAKSTKYTERKTEVEWLRDEAERYGIKMSFQLNGEYCRDARVWMADDKGDDTAHIRDLVTRGHSVGTHFHPYAFTGKDEFWQPYGNDEVTPEVMEHIWRSQIEEVELALGGSFRRIDPAGPRATTALEDKYAELMAEFGFDVAPAGEVFTYTEWEHKPWTPFRQLFPTPLLEDPEGQWVGVTSIGQVGLVIPQGKHALTLGVDQIKRRFMMVYAQWLHQRLTGGPEVILNFGMMTHPDKNLDYRAEVAELMRFFGEEVSTWAGPDGEPVIVFATDEEVVDAYYEWEDEHPGESSFSFDYDAHMGGETQAYPYDLPGISRGLVDAEFEEVLRDGSSDGVRVFAFRYREVFRTPNPLGEPAYTITGVGVLQDAVYLVVADAPTGVDLSATVSGTVYVKAGDTGDVTTMASKAIVAGVVPILVSSSDARFE